MPRSSLPPPPRWGRTPPPSEAPAQSAPGSPPAEPVSAATAAAAPPPRRLVGWKKWTTVGVGSFVALGVIGFVFGDDDQELSDTSAGAAAETSTTASRPPTTSTGPTTTVQTPSTSAPTTTAPPTIPPPQAASEILEELGAVTAAAPTAPPTLALLDTLGSLVADPDPSRPQYDRDRFFEGADLDGDCIRTRHEVLQEEALAFTMSVNGCSVAVGEWYDPFTGLTFTNPADLQMDHVVALGDAWRSGAWAWSDTDRELFANLNVIHGPENQTKADDGPADYTPTNPAHACAYVVQYAAVKAAWALTITQADLDAVQRTLDGCDSLAPATNDLVLLPPTTTAARVAPILPLLPPATTATAAPPPTPNSGCHPAYSPCLPNLAGNAINCGDLTSGQKPVTVLNPAVDPYALDGDNDGVGCEGG